MRLLVPVLFILVSCFGLAQGSTPPPEMSKVADWVGTWKGKEKFMGAPGNPAMDGEATITYGLSLNGRYMEGRHASEWGPVKLAGLHLMTFDPDKKKWIAYWFDSEAPAAMELEGDLNGNAMHMESKPVKVPGMEGMQVFKAEWVMKDKDSHTFTLYSKAGNDWTKVIESSYTRQKG